MLSYINIKVPGKTLKRGDALFPRVAPLQVNPLPSLIKEISPSFKQAIDYEDWEKVDLQAAKILDAETLANSNKLLKINFSFKIQASHRISTT